MRIEFPLFEIETDLGSLPDPSLTLPVKTPSGFLRFRFLLDSGADFTMLPRSVAEQLDINLNDAPETVVAGIEGSGVVSWLSKIEVKIGDREITLPCLFSSNENTPYLLGRMGLFEHFNIIFDNGRKKIILESIKP